MSSLRERLRDLPTFPDELPVLDPVTVPDDPGQLLLAWLDDAIASGERQPSAMTLTTVDDDGRPASRTLIIKDITDGGLEFSSSRSSRKGQHLAARPVATMLFFWRALGRQIEITGPIHALGDEHSAQDWRQRPNYSGIDNPDWQVWALQPDRYEFMQATHDRAHLRVEYLSDPDDGGWVHRPLRPSEAVSPGDQQDHKVSR